jgi:hypothetical protein
MNIHDEKLKHKNNLPECQTGYLQLFESRVSVIAFSLKPKA